MASALSREGAHVSLVVPWDPDGLPSHRCLDRSVDFTLRMQQACPLPGRSLRRDRLQRAPRPWVEVACEGKGRMCVHLGESRPCCPNMQPGDQGPLQALSACRPPGHQPKSIFSFGDLSLASGTRFPYVATHNWKPLVSAKSGLPS